MPQVIAGQSSDDQAGLIDQLLKQHKAKAKKDPAAAKSDGGVSSAPMSPKPSIPQAPVSSTKPQVPASKAASTPVIPASATPPVPTVSPPRPKPEYREKAPVSATAEKDEVNIQKEIEELERQLNERKETLERERGIERAMEVPEKRTTPEKKEITPEQKVKVSDKEAQPIVDDTKPLGQLPPVKKSTVQAILKLSTQDQVKVLTQVVYKHGLYRAIDIAKSLNNPYLYDLLHDELVDQLFAKLKGPKTK